MYYLRRIHGVVLLLAAAFLLAAGAGPRMSAAGDLGARAAAMPTPDEKPSFFPYKGVSIGMSADAARKSLGAPRDKSDSMDMYVFSDSEIAQVFYNAAREVMAISITFSGNLKSAPTPTAVFGEEVEPKPDGGISKMVRYPKAGFWISYNRTSGDDAIVSIAIQKM